MTSFQLKKSEFGLQRPGDRRVAFPDEHVDLGAHAERFRIDARLDGKAGAGDQPPLVVRLEVVHVHAVAVHLGPETVAGPMDELGTEPGPLDHRAAGPVHFETAQFPSRRDRRFHQGHRRVAAVARGGEGLQVAVRDSLGCKPHPRDVVIHCASPLELGPPVGWPLKFRISGPNQVEVRALAQSFAQVLGQHPGTRNINYDWNEPAKVIKVEVDQDRARALGISSQQLSANINAVLSGTTVTQLRESTYLIDIVARAVPEERAKLETLRNLQIETSSGRSVPLAQLATLSYGLEPPLIWRRQRLPTVTVQADVTAGIEATTVVAQLQQNMATFRSKLPPGYSLVTGGTIEDSGKSQASIFAVFPLMMFIMVTILMVQLMSFQRLALVMLTAPLAIIGVALALLTSHAPMGFVAILGIISLIGMVIRNSVLLISQIDEEIGHGHPPWDAVILATEHRMRPILLTAAAAILGMIPIAPTVFWGPMAYAVMGGLMVATLLTLVFLPALYVAWFRIVPPDAEPATAINAHPA